ncbi:MAG: hypothetical protein HY796_06080 [Elusimicrobia bacterium]|nr:hypothetical protein [Elusimicrobiota bacterium]
MRNETLHRLEIELGMFHYLRVVEADLSNEPSSSENAELLAKLHAAKRAAGYADSNKNSGFTPFYPQGGLSKLSGFHLALVLTIGIPFFQAFLIWLFC